MSIPKYGGLPQGTGQAQRVGRAVVRGSQTMARVGKVQAAAAGEGQYREPVDSERAKPQAITPEMG